MKGSKRVLWLIGAWVAATAATAGVALAVVGLAGDQLADKAIEPLSPAEVEALGVTALQTAGDPATSTVPASSEPETAPGGNDPTATVAPTTTTTTTEAAPTPTTAGQTIPTTTQPPATTSTTVPETARVDSRKITGGTVVVRWTSTSVEFVSASPDDGYSVEVEKRGPGKVEVEFEGGGIKSKYAAEVSDGQLVVQTEVENEEEDDGD